MSDWRTSALTLTDEQRAQISADALDHGQLLDMAFAAGVEAALAAMSPTRRSADAGSGPRLHAAIEARRTELGLTLSQIQAAGGPSPRWVQKLRSLDGPPTARMRAPMRRLDAALGWDVGTSWALAGGTGVAR